MRKEGREGGRKGGREGGMEGLSFIAFVSPLLTSRTPCSHPPLLPFVPTSCHTTASRRACRGPHWLGPYSKI
jgi:hypothetical protein